MEAHKEVTQSKTELETKQELLSKLNAEAEHLKAIDGHLEKDMKTEEKKEELKSHESLSFISSASASEKKDEKVISKTSQKTDHEKIKHMENCLKENNKSAVEDINRVKNRKKIEAEQKKIKEEVASLEKATQEYEAALEAIRAYSAQSKKKNLASEQPSTSVVVEKNNLDNWIEKVVKAVDSHNADLASLKAGCDSLKALGVIYKAKAASADGQITLNSEDQKIVSQAAGTALDNKSYYFNMVGSFFLVTLIAAIAVGLLLATLSAAVTIPLFSPMVASLQAISTAKGLAILISTALGVTGGTVGSYYGAKRLYLNAKDTSYAFFGSSLKEASKPANGQVANSEVSSNSEEKPSSNNTAAAAPEATTSAPAAKV